MSELTVDGERVLQFWFRELSPRQWFEDGRKLDGRVRERFGTLLERARKGECDHWIATPRGRLALILLLDQFPRHIHRDEAGAFASDARAQALCLQAIQDGSDEALNVAERHFLYMPLMHAEDPALQARGVEAFDKLREFMAEVVQYAVAHQRQIERFGRFPHRNAALGRVNTPDEQAFIDAGLAGF